MTGPGLPTYGAVYNYVSGSSLLDRIDFKTNSSTTVATANLDYESNRDLLTAVTTNPAPNTLHRTQHQLNHSAHRRT